jgi:hypothetical protein
LALGGLFAMVVAMGEAANRMDDSQDKNLDMDGLGAFVRKDGSDLRITALSGGFSASKA